MLTRFLKASPLLPRLACLAWAGWLGILWWLSSRAIPPGALPSFQFSDKLAHFSYFFAGGICLSFTFRDVFTDWRARALAVVLVSALVGAGDELHQSFVPNRLGLDPWDWLADFAGGMTAALLVCPRFRS